MSAQSPSQPNLLFIMTDQQRFDALGRVQAQLPWYAEKTKVRTPNLDRLSHEGAFFARAYTPCAVCGPCRSSLRTGCTIERTGVQSNDLTHAEVYQRNPLFQQRIEQLETFDQILVEESGYSAEHYGKWHMPLSFARTRDGSRQLYQYSHYNWHTNTPGHIDHDDYAGDVSAFADELAATCAEGQQRNTYSKFPYQPIPLDARYGLPPETPLTTKKDGGQFEQHRVSQPNVMGRDTIRSELTPSGMTARATMMALDRLAEQGKPFALTCSFHCPHAPMVATPAYFDYYWERRHDIYVPASHDDQMENSGYRGTNGYGAVPGQDEPQRIQEWSAAYYALVEEIDHYVGEILQRLDDHGLTDHTLVIFLSDHGEMLGAHGMREKNIFLEESARVPLMVKLPGRIQEQTVVDQAVSLIDVFATILDYCNAGQHDRSDGCSLRRFIEAQSFNQHYDDEAVITEWDFRDPTPDGQALIRPFGSETNFLVVKDQWKLMMTKDSTSSRIDMLYDVSVDPFELNNLIGMAGETASEQTICKAEYLRALLIDWMRRHDGDAGRYSDPIFNAGEGDGDIAEISKRTKWRRLPIWVSHEALTIGEAVQTSEGWQRNEYLYLGRSTAGTLAVERIELEGPDAQHLTLEEWVSGTIEAESYRRVRLAYRSDSSKRQRLDATLRIVHSAGSDRLVAIR